MRIYMLLCLYVVLNNSCSIGQNSSIRKNSAETPGLKNENVYQNDETGWIMRIPNGWLIVNEDAFIASVHNKDSSMNLSTVKTLLVLHKNKDNVFMSFIQRYGDTTRGEWDKFMAERNDQLYIRYTQKSRKRGLQVKCDTSTKFEIIGPRVFRVFELNVYDTIGQNISNQILCSTMFHDSTFTVSMVSNNKSDRQTIMEAWEKSHFSR